MDIDVDMLSRTSRWEAKRRFKRADYTARIETPKKGKKDIVHAFRYLLFALQIFEKVRRCTPINILTILID